VYASHRDGVFRSLDRGRTWEPFGRGLLEGLGLSGLEISADGKLYVGAGNHGLGWIPVR